MSRRKMQRVAWTERNTKWGHPAIHTVLWQTMSLQTTYLQKTYCFYFPFMLWFIMCPVSLLSQIFISSHIDCMVSVATSHTPYINGIDTFGSLAIPLGHTRKREEIHWQNKSLRDGNYVFQLHVTTSSVSWFLAGDKQS